VLRLVCFPNSFAAEGRRKKTEKGKKRKREKNVVGRVGGSAIEQINEEIKEKMRGKKKEGGATRCLDGFVLPGLRWGQGRGRQVARKKKKKKGRKAWFWLLSDGHPLQCSDGGTKRKAVQEKKKKKEEKRGARADEPKSLTASKTIPYRRWREEKSSGKEKEEADLRPVSYYSSSASPATDTKKKVRRHPTLPMSSSYFAHIRQEREIVSEKKGKRKKREKKKSRAPRHASFLSLLSCAAQPALCRKDEKGGGRRQCRWLLLFHAEILIHPGRGGDLQEKKRPRP